MVLTLYGINYIYVARRQVESKDGFGNIQNEDKLLIQSVVAPAAATTGNTSMDMVIFFAILCVLFKYCTFKTLTKSRGVCLWI